MLHCDVTQAQVGSININQHWIGQWYKWVKPEMKTNSKLSWLVLAISSIFAASGAMASTVTMDLNTYLSGPTTGSASLVIQDIGTNQVRVTLTPNFTGTQTVTGLWLNVVGLTSLVATPVSPTPNPFVSSTYAATQTTVPTGATSNLVGQYDLFVKFNNGSGPLIRGTTAETFDLTATGGTGFSALSFNLADAPKGAGSPTNIYGLIGLTNYSSTGSGVGYIAATSASITPTPLPAALPLLLTGLGSLGWLVRRKQV